MLKIKDYWTPGYFYKKIKLYFFEKKNTDAPWFTPDSIKIIENLLKKTDKGLEYGSGRSTLWFARRIAWLTSVEDDKHWYMKIKSSVKKQKNVTLLYKINKNSYVNVAKKFKTEGLDVAIIDGMWRAECSKIVLPKLKSGGMIILDNCERYLPSKSTSPQSIGRKKSLKEWNFFVEATKSWRHVWTTSGVSDTAIFIKP